MDGDDEDGAHIISVNDVYGGTFRYMSRVASTTQSVSRSFLDLEDLSEGSPGYHAFVQTLRSNPNTKLVWVESPTNPTLRVIDIRRISDILDAEFPSSSPNAHRRPLILVDNTFASPYYTSPLLIGADMVMHSLTKYVNGHSDVVMGGIILPERHARPQGPS
jgi:cystathionine gamma-lyase